MSCGCKKKGVAKQKPQDTSKQNPQPVKQEEKK